MIQVFRKVHKKVRDCQLISFDRSVYYEIIASKTETSKDLVVATTTDKKEAIEIARLVAESKAYDFVDVYAKQYVCRVQKY